MSIQRLITAAVAVCCTLWLAGCADSKSPVVSTAFGPVQGVEADNTAIFRDTPYTLRRQSQTCAGVRRSPLSLGKTCWTSLNTGPLAGRLLTPATPSF